MILRCIVYDIGHQNREKFSYSVDAGRKCTISGAASQRLTSLASRLYPLSSYRVYDIEHTQLVSARRLFEMGIDFLDEDGFVLSY